MGNKQSSSGNNCCPERDSLTRQLTTEREQRSSCQSNLNSVSSKFNSLQTEYNELLTAYNMLKEKAMNTGETKDKAKQLFQNLTSQYIDRLQLAQSQKTLISKQNYLLRDFENKKQRQSQEIDKLKTEVHTHVRKMYYDEYTDDRKLLFTNIAKFVLLLLSLVVVLLILREIIFHIPSGSVDLSVPSISSSD